MNHSFVGIATTSLVVLSTMTVIAEASDGSSSTAGATTTSSLLVRAQASPPTPVDGTDEPHALRDLSMFASKNLNRPHSRSMT